MITKYQKLYSVFSGGFFLSSHWKLTKIIVLLLNDSFSLETSCTHKIISSSTTIAWLTQPQQQALCPLPKTVCVCMCCWRTRLPVPLSLPTAHDKVTQQYACIMGHIRANTFASTAMCTGYSCSGPGSPTGPVCPVPLFCLILPRIYSRWKI